MIRVHIQQPTHKWKYMECNIFYYKKGSFTYYFTENRYCYYYFMNMGTKVQKYLISFLAPKENKYKLKY